MRLVLASLLAVSMAASAFSQDIRPRLRALPDQAVQVAQAETGFADWVQSFRARAISDGISAPVFDAAFRGVSVNEGVLRSANRQPEFVKPIWEYLDTAVSDARIANGRENGQRFQQTLARIEQVYGVEAKVVLAIWGMETNYGTFRGDINVIEALATLAYAGGRRQSFGQQQLLAALRIIQNGDTAPANMRGSWAGAMGHTQFIPTSYQSYAVDFDGDGRRDVWGEDPTDALASAANYLRRFGWQKGQPWGVEVRLPEGFNYANIDDRLRQPVRTWTEVGVRSLNGDAVPNYGEASLFAPAGARGPVFMVFQNFRVIKRYNNANSYALGVGHLADRIAGANPFLATWPRGDRPLSRTEKLELQQRLLSRGFNPGAPDGKIGPNTIAAIRAYQRSQGLAPDGYASAALLQLLRGGT